MSKCSPKPPKRLLVVTCKTQVVNKNAFSIIFYPEAGIWPGRYSKRELELGF
jgi:hypothetical protein